MVEINHDYYRLEGFTLDGLYGSSSKASGYRNKLIFAQGTEARAGVKGLKVQDMTIKNAGGECVRLRYFAQDNEIVGNTINTCGVVDFRFGGGGKNGEAIYIGTAVDQLRDGKNPTSDPDESKGNIVRGNRIDTQGAECVNIKEAATGNVVEDNLCTGLRDEDSGGLNIQGNDNVLRDNEVYGNVGAGIRLGGATRQDGIDNVVYGNSIHDNEIGIKFMASPQAKVCGNTFADNEEDVAGTYRDEFEPARPCGDDTSSTSTTSTTSTSTTSTSTTTTSTTSTSTTSTSTTSTTVPPVEEPPSSGPRISEDFSTSASASEFSIQGGTWKVQRGAYVLDDPRSADIGNGNISVYETTIAGDFTLEAEARTEGTRNKFNDFSVLFGYEDADNYCFASFNETNDPDTSGIFLVEEGEVRQLADITKVIKADRTYEVRIDKVGSMIRTSLNGDEVVEVEAAGCGDGKVGFGTRNDEARFDDLVVR